ncbi:MAG: hypothetical protein HKN99_05570 [Winogradskyella sp.]|nr:hypothetical protein [Winogradskyella sp.]
MSYELLQLLVPDEILDHFEYEKLETISNVIRIHLIEKYDPNHYPKALIGKGERQLNGFMNPLELQTFPTQGKEVFLVLKRRRWKIKGGHQTYYNTYDLHEPGMKATKEFGAFLKAIDRG